MKRILAVLFALLLFAGFTAPAWADAPGAHPGYIHALSDLRWARAFVDRDNPGPWDHDVTEEIDLAMKEIRAASIDDGKNLDDHPPIDTNIDVPGRFHRALDLLHQAHEDVSREEDNVFAQGLQHRALIHIDKARHKLKEIINRW